MRLGTGTGPGTGTMIGGDGGQGGVNKYIGRPLDGMGWEGRSRTRKVKEGIWRIASVQVVLLRISAMRTGGWSAEGIPQVRKWDDQWREDRERKPYCGAESGALLCEA
jgi:hypothetical protein